MTQEDRVVAGRYRLGARLGSGAMGVVWQAHDERLHRTVAVKQLLLAPGLSAAQAEEAHQRSMREGRIAARLSHPNAITVYDAVEHGGEPWLIMEYLPSKSLATAISERGSLPPEEVARIGTQVAAALVAAHAAGIVHRDVKPANVLLGEDGTVKITDFGISRATGDVTVTATGMLAGTPAYLAPEVAKGHQPTAASDVFSLGSTLYTAVEGHSPFGLGENTLALLYAVAAGKVSPPRQAGPLTALLMRLLRAEPAERPTMAESRGALAAVAAGKPAPAVDATEVISPHRLPPPPPVMPTPARGMTRLDAHPLSDEPAGFGGPGTASWLERRNAEPLPSARQPVLEPPPPVRQPAAAPPPDRGRNVRSVIFTVLAIVAAALVGILVASLLAGGKHNSSQAGPPVDSTQETTVSTTTTEPTTTTTTSSAQPSTTAPRHSPADYENAVRQYYALLPANPGGAFQLLTQRAQRKSGGQDTYNKFWAKIASVQVLNAKAEGNRVGATLHYVTQDGKQTSEAYIFLLVDQDGRLMIDNFTQAGRGENLTDSSSNSPG